MDTAGELGEVTMSDTFHDAGSILGGILSAPWLKGGVACIAVWCEAAGLPLDLVWALAGFFVADFFLGFWLAVRTRAFSLRKFARGFAKIPVYTLVLLIAWLCQHTAQAVLGQELPVPLWACAYLAMHEALSILAKCEALDLPVPGLLRRVLSRVNAAAEKQVDKVLDAIDDPSQGKASEPKDAPDGGGSSGAKTE